MSLFNDMTAISHQHPENSGSYTFINPIEPDKPEIDIRVEPEPAPTVSLYNLLDQPYDNLFVLLQAVKRMEIEERPNKLAKSFTYTTLCSWVLLIETAIKEAKEKDSEAWAEKTAKEINETL